MSNLDDFRSSKINTWPIVMLRVYTGVFFLYFGIRKVLNPNFGDSVAGFSSSQQNTFGFYQWFVDGVVVPYKGLFAFLVTWGEVVLGIALIIGLATRWAAFAGAFMVANFWFTKGQMPWDAQNHDFIWLVILIVLGGLHAGRTMGLDQRFSGRYKFLS